MTNQQNREEWIEKIWDKYGACQSCGWHSAFYEVEEYFDIDIPCLSDDENRYEHRGAKITLDQIIKSAAQEAREEVIEMIKQHMQATSLNPFYHADQIALRKAYNQALDDLLQQLTTK